MNKINSSKNNTSEFNIFKLTKEECTLLNEVNEFDIYDSFKLMNTWKEINILKDDIQSIILNIISNRVNWEEINNSKAETRYGEHYNNIYLLTTTIKKLKSNFDKLLTDLRYLNDRLLSIKDNDYVCNLYSNCRNKIYTFCIK